MSCGRQSSACMVKQLTDYRKKIHVGFPPVFGQQEVDMTVSVINAMAPKGAVTLVFLPGLQEITRVQEQLEQMEDDSIKVYIQHSSMPHVEQAEELLSITVNRNCM